jgi:hypothetical protein
MSRIRTVSLFLVTALAFAPVHAGAQLPPGAANNVSARLAALEAKVARLEGNITAGDLVGTYRAAALATDLDGGPPASVQMFAYGGTIQLNPDGLTGEIVQGGGTSGVIDLVQGSPWTDGAQLIPTQPPIPITWTYSNGIVHISDGTVHLQLDLIVGVGGRVLIWAGLSDDNTADIIIATRLQ